MEPISRKDFCERTGICSDKLAGQWDNATRVVSPRDLATVFRCSDMPKWYLVQLLDAMPLSGDRNCFPYKLSPKFDLECTDIQHVRTGQLFVQKDKLLSLMDNKKGLTRLTWDFTAPRGLGRLTAKILLGNIANNEMAVAHYLPPILEEHLGEHGTVKVGLDGNHRMLICLNAGIQTEAIIIRKVTIPFPCDLHKWTQVQQVNVKPPLGERYNNLCPSLFRDLKYVGIDG